MTETLLASLPSMELAVSAGLHMFNDRWLEFCNEKWSVTPQRIQFADGDGPRAEALYYFDRTGRIWKPPFSPGPYLPVTFQPTPTESRARRNRQWLAVGGLLAEDMRERGLARRIALPPEITDVRPWQWAGFQVEVLYTYCVDLPYDQTLMRPQIRRSIAKSTREGFTCARTTNLDDVYECLAETERRQGFQQRITARDLELAQGALGRDAFRAYAAYSADGDVASATIELHEPDGRAVGWIAGTKCAYINSGVSQHLNAFLLEDLAAGGATGYDFAGANLPSVAMSKSQWGAHLVPFYCIESGGIRDLARNARSYWRFRRAAA